MTEESEEFEQKQSGEPKEKNGTHLLALAYLNGRIGRPRRALEYARRALTVVEESQELIRCYLMLGLIEERLGDYYFAIAYYSLGLSHKPSDKGLSYFFNNSLAYCLNVLGKYEESEPYCREAIHTDVRRHSAHKNLGVCLQGLGSTWRQPNAT